MLLICVFFFGLSLLFQIAERPMGKFSLHMSMQVVERVLHALHQQSFPNEANGMSLCIDDTSLGPEEQI